MKVASRLWQASTIFLGAAFVGYLLNRFGASNVWLALQAIGWRLAIIIALEALVHVTNARAWWHLFPTRSRHEWFARVWLVHLAGSALNDITPGAPIGGDPFKALALRKQFTMSVTTATLLSAKVSQALARAIFVILGLLAVASSIKLESFPVRGLGVGLLLTAVGLAMFTALQLRGLSKPARSLFRRLRFPDEWVERIGGILEHVDEHLFELYGTRRADFFSSVALVLGGLGVGVFQTWLIMGWIGRPCDWLASLAIESISVLLGFVFFVVPGSLGVQEGGKLLIFAALGLPLSAGLSLGIIFRLSSLVNLGAGFVALLWLRYLAFFGTRPVTGGAAQAGL